MASLEYVMARWLTSSRLTVASVGAGRGFGVLRPCPVREGDWGRGIFCLAMGASVGAFEESPGSTQGGVLRCIWCLCGPCSRQ